MRCLLLSFLVALVAVGTYAQFTSETFTLHSPSYSSFRQIFAHSAPDASVNVLAKLSFPAASSGSVPVVVIVHTLAGFRDQNEGWQAEQSPRVDYWSSQTVDKS